MKDLYSKIKALPGIPRGQKVYLDGWVSRIKVLKILEDTLKESDLSDRFMVTALPDEAFQIKTCIDDWDRTMWTKSARSVFAQMRAFLEAVLKLDERPPLEKPKITINIEYPDGFSYQLAWELQKALENTVRDFDIRDYEL